MLLRIVDDGQRRAATQVPPARRARASIGRARAPIGLLGIVLILAAVTAGCAGPGPRPTRPDASPTLVWVSPAAGDTVAGFITLQVEIHGTGIREVTFLADRETVDTVTAAPWTGRWHCRFVDAPAPVELAAVIRREDGSSVPGGAVGVVAFPNRPPRLTVRLPRPTTWLERAPGARLEAIASDPEEGPLPSGRIHWTGSLLGRPVTGDALPLEILFEEEQSIVVEAEDRWNECVRETLNVRPFRYAAADTPSACSANAAAAIRAMDPAGLAGALADSFIFVPCAAEAASAAWPATWARGTFLDMAARWLQAPSIARVEFDWGSQRVDEWRVESAQRAWMEGAGAFVRFRETCATAGSESGASEREVTAASGSTMQLSLRREAGGSWRIAEWRELASGVGQSLAGLLASTAGLAAPRAGAGCAVSPAGRPVR